MAINFFAWKEAGGVFSGNIVIPTSAVNAEHLTRGVHVWVDVNDGHTLNDEWTISVALPQDNSWPVWTVIGMKYFNQGPTISTSTDAMVLILYNRLSLQYALGWILVDTLLNPDVNKDFWSELTILKTSKSYFGGLVLDPTSGNIYAYAAGEGRIYTITKAGVLSLANNFPAIGDEYGLLAGLTSVYQDGTEGDQISAGDPDLYGVSAINSHIEADFSYVSGKYNLFRLHQSIGDLIPLADFTDLSKWEAIKLLSQSTDSFAFFNRNGDFVYTPREYSTAAADFTIGSYQSLSEDEIKMSMGYGYKDVLNTARVAVYGEKFVAPEQDIMILVNRSTKNELENNENEIPFVNYSLEQRDTRRKRVLCFCTVGGTVSDGNSRWKYTVIKEETEAVLDTDYNGSVDVTMSLESVFGGDSFEEGIHVGDFFTAINPTTGVAETRAITVVNTSTQNIDFVPVLGFDLVAGTVIKIGKGFKLGASTNTKATWSDEGVSYVLGVSSTSFSVPTVQAALNLAVGMIVRFGSNSYEYRIIAYDGSISFTIERAHDQTNSGFVDGIKPAANDIIYGWYSPNSTDTLQIPGSLMFLTWEAGVGIQGTDYTDTFLTGDRIEIEAPGTSLESQAESLQVAVDGDSVAKNGKKEISIDNKFLHRSAAFDLAKRIIVNRADPKPVVTIVLPLQPHLDFVNAAGKLTKVDLYNPELFPTSNNFTEQFTIDAIEHDLRAFETTLRLKSLNSF